MDTYSPQGNICGPIMPRFILGMKISMGAKMVYSILCDYAKEKDHCWPSHDSISKALAVSVSSVKNWLNELRDYKLIAIDRRSYHSCRYYMLRPSNSGNSAPVNALRPDRPKYGRFGQTLATERNVKKNKDNTPPLPPAKLRPSVDSSFHEHRKRGGGDFVFVNSIFEKFWSVYPRQEAKELARAAWHRLWRQGLLPALEVLVSALDKFRATAMWNKEHGRFIPQLCNWLKGQRWLDEISDAGASLTPEEKATQEKAQQALAHFEQQEQARQARHEAETARLRPDFERFLSNFSDGSKMRGPAWGLWCSLHRRGMAPKAADVPYGSQCGVYEFLKNFEMEKCYV